MLGDILIFAEYDGQQVEAVTLQMLTEGRKLSSRLNCKIGVCLICADESDALVDPLGKYGAEKIFLIEKEGLRHCSLDVSFNILKGLIEKYSPSIIMVGATPRGSELAARIAARLRLRCVTEAKRIESAGKSLRVSKSGFNDKVYFNFEFELDRPLLVTVIPGDMDSNECNKHSDPEIIREDVQVPTEIMHTRNTGFIKGDPKTIGLEEAELIVAGGKGVDKKEFVHLESLAELLGASVGGTRPIVDEGIIPLERQIGITGKKISPKMIMCLGISGAREFIGGIENSKLTVAINNDAKARIFNSSDIGVLGDVNEIIPALIRKLKEMKKDK